MEFSAIHLRKITNVQFLKYQMVLKTIWKKTPVINFIMPYMPELHEILNSPKKVS